ncbi:low temperature requirement protein A [Nocardia sp. NPDC005978]|uniref:low temperature requirement protein A n=1 Tax=Nocardia sp. NPDC005978 TaxID=3156725 RepID=UPI0033BC271F
MAEDGKTGGAQRTNWLELFFDLVAVAGLVQLTHLLRHGPSFGYFALYLLLYLAFWTAWACITLYSDIASDRTHPALMLAAMLGLGVMAAAVAGVPERHATTFAAVYVVLRVATAQAWGRGFVVVDWPTAQLSFGVLPWIVSLWVDAPWKYYLWGLGLAIDLWLMFAISGERLLSEMQDRLDRRLRKSRRFQGVTAPKLRAVHANPEHLGERLGLYVIIVLGEGVITVIDAVGGELWTAEILMLGLGAFLILTGLWALTLRFGPVPRLISGVDGGRGQLPWQHIMATHCWVTGALATIAAGLGLTISHANEHLSAGTGWVLGGGLAAYFGFVGVSGLRSGARWQSLFTHPLPCIAAALLLGWLAPHIGPVPLVYGLVLVIAWALLWQSYADGKLRRDGSGPARPHREPRPHRRRGER